VVAVVVMAAIARGVWVERGVREEGWWRGLRRSRRGAGRWWWWCGVERPWPLVGDREAPKQSVGKRSGHIYRLPSSGSLRGLQLLDGLTH
jgi:hypothetical protein